MNEFSKMLTLFGLIFICSISSIHAQDESCIRFEDLDDGAVYGEESGLMSGDEFYSEAGVSISLETFHYFNGNTAFLNIFVSNDPFLDFSGEGLYVFPSNVNLEFDFSELPATVTTVCFDFADGGGVENLAVNGEEIIVLESFTDAPTEIASGVTLELLIDPNSNSPTGTVCLSGEIHSLLVGGQELAIDNVCFATQPFPCNLFDLEAAFIGCDDEGNYSLEVGVQSNDDINTEVEVFVEQESYGTFGLVDFPLTLEGIPPIDDAEVLFVKVCELQGDDPCCMTTEVVIESCSNSGCIEFEGMPESVYGGNEGHEPGEVIYVESDIPLSLFEFQNFDWTTSFHQLQVLQADDFPEFSTAMGQYIRLDGISAIFNFSVVSGPVEMVTLDFYYDFGPVNVSANGAPITTLAVLTDGFVNIGPGVNMEIIFSEDNPMMGTITFTGNIYTLLLGGNALRIDNVCADPTCAIENLEVIASDCDDDNQFTITLDFDYTFVSDTFALWLNGDEASFHDYNDLPLTLGPFTGPVDEELVFDVKDRENPDCRATATLDPINCQEDCDIRDMVAEQSDCDNNGGFDIILDFIHENTSEHFDLFVNGELWGDYAYADLPIHFGPFFENEAIHLLVRDVTGACAEDLLFEPHPCFDVCTFTEVLAEAHDCNDDGYFFVDIEFNAHNPGPLGYYVFGDGQIFGPFNYDEIFVTVGPFEGDGSSIYDFLLLDIANPACFGYYELGPINCNNQQCEIFELVVDPLECNDDGTYQLYIDFEVVNPGNDFFDVLNHDGEVIGFFPLADLPIIIPHFHGSGNNYDVVKICINDNPDCCRVREFEAPNCSGGDCHIFDVIAEAHPCTPNGIFYVDIAFGFENVGNEGYKIQGNGHNYGTFSYNEPFPTLGPFNGDGETIYEFVIIDLQHPNCSNHTTVGPINCDALPCEIHNLTVETLDCNNDGTYQIRIDFEVDNPGNDFFEVFTHDGDLIGYFSLNELPLTIHHFQPSGEPVDVIKVCINDHPDCCRFAEFEAPNCNGGNNCTITELEAVPHCNDNGTYNLVIDFEVLSPGNNFFEVFNANGEYLGFFPIADLPVTLEDYQGSAVVEQITVCINDIPECCYTTEFVTPNCNSFCSIFEIEVDPLECDGLNTYSLWLNFQHEHTSGVGFDVFSGDDFIGFYSYEDLPVTVHHFPQRLNSDYDIITICDNDNPNCCKTIEFMGEDCSTDFCLEFEDYADLEEPQILAEEGDSGLVIHQETGVVVSAAEIVFANSNGLLQNVSISPTQLCDAGFEAAEGVRLYMEGGIRLDFSSFAIKPTIVSFDYAYCPGTDFINLAFNNSDPFYGFFDEIPDVFHDIQVIVEPSNNVGTQGRVTLMGELEFLLIGGIPLHIDNICFNGIPEDEEVWPGDGNSDNIAHHIDLLNIGLGFGTEGTQRDQLSISWEGMVAANWDDFFADGTNYKHADCNGDGIINELDKGVIVQNYNLTHGNVADHSELPGTDIDPPIFVDFSDAEEWPSASNFEVPIVLGSADHPVDGIYGLAFTITVDPTIFNLNALAVEYSNSWFGEEGDNMLTIEKIYAEEGKIEIALTRTDQENISGHGTIAHLVGIIDDIAGIRADTKVDVALITAIDNDENPIPLHNPTQDVRIVKKKDTDQPTVGRIDLRRGTTIFPNPAQNWIEVSNKFGLSIDSLELFDSKGRATGKKVTNGSVISLEGLPQGIYMLKFQVGEHIIHERIVKM